MEKIHKTRLSSLLITLLLVVFIFGNTHSQILERDITIRIDTLKVYPFGSEELAYQRFYHILKSPFKKNHIWIGSDILVTELNLETGVYRTIGDILGYKVDGIAGVEYDFTGEDPFDDNIYWIYINGTGMIKYQRNTRSHRLYNIKNLEKIEFTRDNLILGDKAGKIYLINKTLDWVSIFDKGTDNSDLAFEKEEGTETKRNKLWLYPGANFKQVYEGKDVWFYDQNQLFEYDTTTGVLSNINYKPDNNIDELEVDGTYVYLLDQERFTVINKQFLKEDVIIQQPQNTKEYRLFKLAYEKCDQYRYRSVDVQINNLKQLYQTYSGSTNIYIINDLYGRTHSFAKDDRFTGNFKRKIETDPGTTELMEHLLYELVRYYNRKAIVDSAFYYHSILIHKFPDSKLIDNVYTDNILIMKKVSSDLAKLDSLHLPEDEYLMRKAEICSQLVSSDWNCGESCNFEIYLQFYRVLLDKYPDSEYADNAEYILIELYEDLSHEGGNQSANLEFISEYNQFLEKYPNSKFIPDVLYQLAGLYEYADVSWEKLYDFNKKALELFHKIKTEFPDYQNRFLDYSINQVTKNLPTLALSLSIKSDKEIYSYGEPINISISLRNNNQDTAYINIGGLDSIPFAFFEINKIEDMGERREFVQFDEISSSSYFGEGTIVLAPNREYVEVHDITKNALNWDHYYTGNYRYGYFILPTGKYQITAYEPFKVNEYYMHSEPILIEVK